MGPPYGDACIYDGIFFYIKMKNKNHRMVCSKSTPQFYTESCVEFISIPYLFLEIKTMMFKYPGIFIICFEVVKIRIPVYISED